MLRPRRMRGCGVPFPLPGESNTGPDVAGLFGPKNYACALREMIKDWRLKLGIPSLPFLVVELSAYAPLNATAPFYAMGVAPTLCA